eukprot:gene1929-5018_t
MKLDNVELLEKNNYENKNKDDDGRHHDDFVCHDPANKRFCDKNASMGDGESNIWTTHQLMTNVNYKRK